MDEKLQELLPGAVGISQGIDDNSHVLTIAQAGPNVDATSKYRLHQQAGIEDVSESVAQKVETEHDQENSEVFGDTHS